MRHRNSVGFVREAVIAVVVVVGLYGLSSSVQFSPAQIPAYLLIVGFDMLEVTFGSAGAYYPVLFGAYLVGLGVAGAVVVHTFRRWTSEADLPSWRLGVAGAFTVVGALSLLFALSILIGTSQMDAVVITGVTGLIFLALAGWLAGLLI
jgi:hypothetical protein